VRLVCSSQQRSPRRGADSCCADASGYAAEAKTKESYLQLATQTLNESTRLDPSAAVNSLARGIYSIFKASSQNPNERNHHLETAQKIFDDAIRNSRGGNMLALMGKARVLYARKRYDKALECYQEVLLKRPDMDPDPRIGIGMCFWMLGHKEDAKMAWERTLEIDPDSKVAHSLMAAYYLHVTSTTKEHDPSWMNNYRQVIDHTQKAYKLDKNFPMACTAFASHFFSKKGYQQCESLAKRAIEFSDVAGVTSDGWYILGRKAHAEGELATALSCYRKSDQAREGGWLPAKIGVGQVQVLMKDIPSAKLTFEAIVHENPKCQEAKTILGTLYAHEVLSAVPRSGFAGSKDDVTDLHKKAIYLLEGVRNIWKNDKRTDPANEAVLLTLARLYEHDQPEKSLLCLQAVHQIYMEVRETDKNILVPIQLLNNMATLYWHQEKYDKARELYQEALEAIPLHKERDEHLDSDALATTLTYNLGRCEEAAGNTEQATKHYNQLLQFHDDYVDANMRLTYMALRNTSPEGPKMMAKLMQTDGNNLEVRALNGWYLSKQKKKPPVNIAEDAEQRHFKHSLQHYDKHDRFSLTGMGNLYLHTAREMPRATESDKEKKRKTYEKAVEFFDKVLQLDPKNAYAAQGIAIAMIEDKKDLRGAVGILTKVRETLANDGRAVVNLGHCLAGLEQWGRAIEMVSSFLFFSAFLYHSLLSIIPFSRPLFPSSKHSTLPLLVPGLANQFSSHCLPRTRRSYRGGTRQYVGIVLRIAVVRHGSADDNCLNLFHPILSALSPICFFVEQHGTLQSRAGVYGFGDIFWAQFDVGAKSLRLTYISLNNFTLVPHICLLCMPRACIGSRFRCSLILSLTWVLVLFPARSCISRCVHASWIIAFPGCNHQVWHNGYGPLTFCDQYETALSKHNQGRDPNILSCLGRVWYAKGKKESKMEKEKAFESMKNSLEYAKKVSPSQPASQFR
jgi:RNA polymerase-associated protein CTR9